jgi:hypothetical protein
VILPGRLAGQAKPKTTRQYPHAGDACASPVVVVRRPGSRSKYAKSSPGCDMTLVDSGIAIDPFAQLKE